MTHQDEFYVGYLPKAPPRNGRIIAYVIAVLGLIAAAVALLLAAAQRGFGDGTFEYGVIQPFSGVLREHPYPHLELDLGGTSLLVATGKHGLADQVRGLDGARVTLRGTRIYRGSQSMIQVEWERPAAAAERAAPAAAAAITAESITLTGEIVDSKCWLGVMNPGEGKVHRDCAVRCISGGVPPSFLVRDEAGEGRALLLSNRDGGPLGREILSYVAEPVRVTGTLLSTGELRIDPFQIKRTGE